MSPTMRHHRPDESTPLLRDNSSTTTFNYTTEHPTQCSTPEIDEESLDLDLARVQSIPHGGEIEPGFPPTHAHDHEGAPGADDKRESHFIGVSPAQFWTIFSGMLFNYTLAFFDSTLMGSIHPVITSHFNAANSASWLSTSFLLTCTAFQPLFGRISDTFGRRPVYLFSILVFFLTTAWCAEAQSIGSFIAARACGGLGAGGVTSLGLIISSDLIHVEYRGIYQSYINLFYGIGGSLGVACGGFIVDLIGWRAAFGIQLPFIFICLVIAYFTTPSSLGPELAKKEGYGVREAIKTIDLTGSFLLVVGVTALMLGINLGGNVLSWSHPFVISSLVAFCFITIFFLRVEAKQKRPCMPLNLLSSAPRANLIFGNFFGNFVIHTVLFNVPLFFQAVRQDSPSKSGLRLLTTSVGLMVTSVMTGFIITWSRRLKPTLVVGALFLVCGGITTSLLSRSIPDWLTMVLITPSSFGQGFAFPTTMMSVLATSDQADQAVVTTTLGLFRNLGSVMGVAISSWVLQNSLIYYLDNIITGPDSAGIILRVRKSISEISRLDPLHKDQAIQAYEKALRATFLSSILFGTIVVLLVLPIKLPRLGRKR
ncbi:hypothetical protein AJ80_03895 [Polytolypa hystricis UAMH7299]|uniref:Major facilitator superfamily (MFS) profile domain-containing protein n=1 Tax=Polytolypa hystricis (strain UAMH7299) TaxID=1447883 RepID=A0A2B7YEQ4_POLH7|nr:hypothetical protein AJ80_03895 [Polytolypa hystricis UAMH7299]